MLYNYAAEIPSPTIYPIFKNFILLYCQHPEPLYRKAGIKILGHVADNDALLDNIKEDIDELVNLLVAGLTD